MISTGGQALQQSARSFFEPRLGHDFSHVRVHTDRSAADSAQSYGARAYTYANNIVFIIGLVLVVGLYWFMGVYERKILYENRHTRPAF